MLTVWSSNKGCGIRSSPHDIIFSSHETQPVTSLSVSCSPLPPPASLPLYPNVVGSKGGQPTQVEAALTTCIFHSSMAVDQRSNFDPASRKRILRVLFISLLLDLVGTQKHSWKHSLTIPDFVHLHPTTLPIPHCFLSWYRSRTVLRPEPHPAVPQRLQEVFLCSHRFQI